jgi:hypothetical protein
MADEIVKSRKMTPAERMAKARAVRDANKAARMGMAQAVKEHVAAVEIASKPPQRQMKKAPIVKEEEISPARTQTRQGARTRTDGRVEVVGHNGEVLSRTRVQVGDIFEIPGNMIPVGWTYQWNAVSVAGNSEILLDQNHMMYQNGWRAVPAERYAGTLVPKGSTGNIIRGQQMLMERPEELTMEARAEDERNARQLISDRNEALKLSGVKKNLGEGFEMSGKYKGSGGDIRMSIDKGLDIPRPQHTLADPE